MYIYIYIHNVMPKSFSRRAFHCDVWNQICKIPNLTFANQGQLRRYLQQCGLQNCHQETRPYRKEVRKESSQVSLVRSDLFAFQDGNMSQCLKFGSFSTPDVSMSKLFQRYRQGQMEELDLTPTYKQCPDAQEGMPVQGFTRIISSMFNALVDQIDNPWAFQDAAVLRA